MIPAIGYMIGFYILTRMFSVLMPNKESEKPFIQILAGITIMVVVVCLILLFTSELKTADSLKYFNR